MKIKNNVSKKLLFLIFLVCLFFLCFKYMKKNSHAAIHSEVIIHSIRAEEKNKDSRINTNNDYVVLMHGIASGSWYMASIADSLAKEGYIVINLDYPSRTIPIERLRDLIYKEIIRQINILDKTAIIETKERKIHFVGHSMGAFLIRSLLNTYTFENLGKVVQLAPPNKGSEIADFFYDFSLYKLFYGPAGKELSTKEIMKFDDSINYELGVIAGSKTLAPFSSLFLLKGSDDGRVRVENTKIKGMKEHIVVPVSHTLMGFNEQVMENIVYFIKNASFKIKE